MDNTKNMQVSKDTSLQSLASSKKGFNPKNGNSQTNLKSNKLNKIDNRAFLEDGTTKFQMFDELEDTSDESFVEEKEDDAKSPFSTSNNDFEYDASQANLDSDQSDETGVATKNQTIDELENTSSKSLVEPEKYNIELPSSLTSINEPECGDSQTDLNSNQSNETGNIDNFKNKTIKIHLIDGEKGGCGKSFFTKSFIKYCDSIAHDLIIIDADKSNEDIFNLYKEHKTKKIRQTFFSDDDNKQKEADSIFTAALENKSVLVNLPAQVADKLNSWLDSGDLINLAKENKIQFIKWFVCNGSVESFNFFLNSLKSTDMQHVLVENLGLCDQDGWKFIKEKPEFESAKTQYNFISMSLHKFPFYERNVIDQNQIPFTDILDSKILDTVSKSRVRRMFFEKMDSAFKETKIIDE